MCLGVPGQIESIIDAGNGLAWVSLSGVRREVNISCVQTDADATALIGQWVIVHAGFALELLDEAEALRTLDLLRALEQSQAGIPS
ncbi:MAG: HypC/HybG/HupF family hydrogenase formation chaperone [Gammaproteobacteria bacterium]